MNQELKQDFIRRLSQCNRGELVVITYEILLVYIDDVENGIKTSDREKIRYSVNRAQDFLDELISTLDFNYELSDKLCKIYFYCKKQLSKAIYENRTDSVDEVKKIIEKLADSFREAAKQDKSAPLMDNAQQVYAGITYGRTDLNESCIDNSQRGFLA